MPDDAAEAAQTPTDRLSTGIDGLDELVPERSYLVRGRPGTGKTTLGLHFLTAGADEGPPLFINLEETTADIEQNAAGLGGSLSTGSRFWT